MATISSLVQGGFQAAGGARTGIIAADIDLAAAQTAKGSALVANDVIQCLNIPAGCFVHQVGWKVLTSSTGTAAAANFGAATADGFDAAGDIKTAANEGHGAPGTDAYLTAGGLYLASADTIDMTLSTVTSITAWGKVRVWALVSHLL